MTRPLLLGIVCLWAACGPGHVNPHPDASVPNDGGNGGSGGSGGGSGGSGGSGSDGGTGAIADCPNTSGSRLHPRFWGTSDGFRQFIGWHDSQRNEDCSFAAAADGTQRCMPNTNVSVNVFFSDLGCTKPIAQSPSCQPPSYVFGRDGTFSACAANQLFPVTGSATIGAQVYAKTAAGCLPLTPSHGAYVTLGPQVDYTGFVAATVSKASASTRLVPYVLTADDGAVQRCAPAQTTAFDRVYDTQRNEDCQLGYAADGLTRCLPRAKGSGTTFSDAKCTMPAFPVTMGCGAAPMYGLTSDMSACGSPPVSHLFNLGTALASAFVNVTNAGGGMTCQPDKQTATFYAPGTEIAAASFVEEKEMSLGNGRLRARMYVTSDGLQQFRGSFDDTQLSLECNFTIAADGQVRCLPEKRSSIVDGFSDPKCMTPLNVVAAVGSATCPATAPGYAAQLDSNCPGGTHIFAVGAKANVTTAYSNTSGTCMPLMLNPSYTFFAVGSEIAPTMFATATTPTN
jgi:hypothetical protein